MWVPTAYLLLCGLSLGPVRGAFRLLPEPGPARLHPDYDMWPMLWAEPESLQDPGANLTLVCQAQWFSSHFQLFRDGVAQNPVHLEIPERRHRFPLGTISEDTSGLYRCRCGQSVDNTWVWTKTSELVPVTLPGSLPAPELTNDDHSWTSPGRPVKLRCRAGLHGLSYELKREGDSAVQTARDPRALEATFSVQDAGNYSCSYRTHEGATPSPPSASLQVLHRASPLPPKLEIHGARFAVAQPGEDVHLSCTTPLWDEVPQLLHEGKVLPVIPRGTPRQRTFMLGSKAVSGSYTCRYRRSDSGEDAPWSSESQPVELLLSDGSLPAPKLYADLSKRPVQMRCVAPRSGVRFALQLGWVTVGIESPEGPEAVFELNRLSLGEAGSYSCVYADPQPPFAGSRPSPSVSVQAIDLLPRPRLLTLAGPVTPGRDARLRCEGSGLPAKFELLRVGKESPVAEDWGDHVADLLLHNVGPQHAGNYTCRYRHFRPLNFVSELSEPVQLSVAGSSS